MIFTNSAFYYGLQISDSNQFLAFSEDGGPELLAQLRIGRYTLTTLAAEVARAMNAIGSQEYAVNIDRVNRTYEIEATDAMPVDFSLLISSGSSGSSAFSTIGFTGSDLTLSTSYTSNTMVGSSYRPQFRLQDFCNFDDNQKASESNVLTSASGQVEVIKFGNIKIMECQIMYITDLDMKDVGYIRTDLSGVQNARSFMVYATTKGPIEFIPDILNPQNFTKCILETTPESQEGVNFKLKEEYGKGLPGFYTTGKLTFREVE